MLWWNQLNKWMLGRLTFIYSDFMTKYTVPTNIMSTDKLRYTRLTMVPRSWLLRILINEHIYLVLEDHTTGRPRWSATTTPCISWRRSGSQHRTDGWTCACQALRLARVPWRIRNIMKGFVDMRATVMMTREPWRLRVKTCSVLLKIKI